MKTPFGKTTRYAALLLLAGVALGGCTSLATAPPTGVQHQIEVARTRADHETLVKYYESEVATARAKAAEHREMGKRYSANATSFSRDGGGSMQVHCNSVAASFDQIAERFATMAGEHRRMAEQAKP